MKILVCPLFWDGDRDAMADTVELACDLLTRRSHQVSLLSVSRYDSPRLPNRTLRAAEDKFSEVYQWTCDRIGSGFPFGCNELAFGVLNHIGIKADWYPDYDAILIFEADCVFTRQDWDVDLIHLWSQTIAAGKTVCGTVIPGSGKPEYPHHVNAVAMYEFGIARKHMLYGCPFDKGWDWYLGDVIVPLTLNTNEIRLDYQRPSITQVELYGNSEANQPPLIYHGVKDSSAREAVRKHYGIQ